MNNEKKQSYVWVGILAGFMVVLLLLAGFTLYLVLTNQPKVLPAENDSTKPSETVVITDSVLSNETEAKLRTLRAMLDEDYLFGTEDVDFDTEVIRAYVDALGDPYTVYYTPEEYNDLMESNRGTFYGIGVSIQQDVETMSVTVIQVFKGSPAEEAGVLPGDIIYAVDGVPVGQDDINLTVTKVRGPEGSVVKISFYRPSISDYVEFEITRREVQVQSATGEMLEGNIGYIQLSSFDEVTYSQFAEAYNELLAQGMKAVIFDLRNNGGGLLSSVVNIVDQLVPAGIITYTLDKNGQRSEYKSDAKGVLNIPAVVLTNENTASASEIFTAALHDYEKATIIGTTTFGKGIVQAIYPLTDGSGVKITISRYYTPNGICIHGEGIAPDVEVDLDYDTEEDEQLNEAISFLQKKLQ